MIVQVAALRCTLKIKQRESLRDSRPQLRCERDRPAIHEQTSMADHRMLRLFVSSVEVSLERR